MSAVVDPEMSAFTTHNKKSLSKAGNGDNSDYVEKNISGVLQVQNSPWI